MILQAFQLPRQDLALAYCRYVEPQNHTSYQDFVAARNDIALDIAYVKDHTRALVGFFHFIIIIIIIIIIIAFLLFIFSPLLLTLANFKINLPCHISIIESKKRFWYKVTESRARWRRARRQDLNYARFFNLKGSIYQIILLMRFFFCRSVTVVKATFRPARTASWHLNLVKTWPGIRPVSSVPLVRSCSSIWPIAFTRISSTVSDTTPNSSSRAAPLVTR